MVTVRNGPVDSVRGGKMNDILDQIVRSLPEEYPGLAELHPHVVYLMGCRNFNQFCCTWRSLERPKEFCPFCEQELERRTHRPVFRSGEWMLLQNEFPRSDTEQMLLVVPQRHIVEASDFSGSDWMHIGVLFELCCDSLGFPGCAMLMRSGDPRDHAGTIEHLHFNVIRPIREGGCTLPIAKHHSDHVTDFNRLKGFSVVIDMRGGMEWLFSRAGVLETQPAMA